MLPIPTRSAALVFIGCVATICCGIAAASPTAVVFAGGCLLGLATALALTMPLGARLRRERLEFAWWHAHSTSAAGEHGVVVGAPIEVRCYVRNRGVRPLRMLDLAPSVPQGVEVIGPERAELRMAPRSRAEFSFRVRALAAGRVVLQGLAVSVPGPFGLFIAPLYFPSPLAIKVLPRAAARALPPSTTTGGQSVERVGVTPLRRPGAGTDLHEIRELRPGDPFKSIAWKPSARAGRLMVREVEREVQETIYLILDISGSMRGGAPGDRKLDHCIEMVSVAAREALERGDRVGLITVDGRVATHVAASEGLQHMTRIYRALLESTDVVDSDLTEVDDEDVVELVGRYLKRQHGLDLSRDGTFELSALVQHAERALQADRDEGEVVAGSPQHATLRRFCRKRGIPLPYRAETRAFAKAEGLARALQTAAGNTRAPRTILLLSDFDGVFDPAPLLKTLALLRARRHLLSCVFPDARSLTPPAASGLRNDLHRVYSLQESRRLAEVRALFGRLGVPVVAYGARDDKLDTIRRAQTARRVA
ncbi:MAG: DUF58 domain-containing protein [Myxococcales bacterium]|nr:DUF58 domain-containing protein [Myxococcales bacterium]